MLTISIHNLWNGESSTPKECYTLSLRPDKRGYLLDIEAPYFNDPKPIGPKGSFWKLWDYEVVELFIVGSNGHYLEIECGPHGHYLVLQLDGVRSVASHSLQTKYNAQLVEEKWLGQLVIPVQWLPPAPHRINAFAIHGVGAERRYLSFTPLPGETPDFHQPSQFRPSELPNIG